MQVTVVYDIQNSEISFIAIRKVVADKISQMVGGYTLVATSKVPREAVRWRSGARKPVRQARWWRHLHQLVLNQPTHVLV